MRQLQTNVTMTVTFEVDDAVDGSPLADRVRISIPHTTPTTDFTLSDGILHFQRHGNAKWKPRPSRHCDG